MIIIMLKMKDLKKLLMIILDQDLLKLLIGGERKDHKLKL